MRGPIFAAAAGAVVWIVLIWIWVAATGDDTPPTFDPPPGCAQVDTPTADNVEVYACAGGHLVVVDATPAYWCDTAPGQEGQT